MLKLTDYEILDKRLKENRENIFLNLDRANDNSHELVKQMNYISTILITGIFSLTTFRPQLLKDNPYLVISALLLLIASVYYGCTQLSINQQYFYNSVTKLRIAQTRLKNEDPSPNHGQEIMDEANKSISLESQSVVHLQAITLLGAVAIVIYMTLVFIGSG